jgi:pimeloyl-ACP methyl ester carboxylesterase
MATFVLIHGALHGAWCWREIAESLERNGHIAVVPDLPGHGQDPTPRSTVTLDAYVDRICCIVDSFDEPVILVGHSFAGFPITEVAERKPERVRSLVYLAAFLPRNGDTAFSLVDQDSEGQVIQHVFPGADGTLEFPKEMAAHVFYGCCSEEIQRFAASQLTPEPIDPLSSTVHTTNERWGSVPRYYVECLRDRAVGPASQSRMQLAQPCRKVFTMDTDHSPFFSSPKELVATLLEIERADAS